MKEGTEKIKQLLKMLGTVKLDEARFKEVERSLSQIVNELEKAINAEELPDLRPLYEQQGLMIKIQSVFEDIRKLMAELEELKKKLESLVQ